MTNWVSEAVLGCSKSIVWVETTDLVGQQTMRSDRIIDFLFFKYSNHVWKTEKKEYDDEGYNFVNSSCVLLRWIDAYYKDSDWEKNWTSIFRFLQQKFRKYISLSQSTHIITVCMY